MKNFLTVLILSCLSLNAWAHKPSDSYLALTKSDNQLNGQWDIALRDLEFAIGLDTDNNAAITWQELKKQQAVVFAYALNHLNISAHAQNCQLMVKAMLTCWVGI